MIWCILIEYFLFFKQKTAYEMRIRDWRSDVCSSDLLADLDILITDAAEQRDGRADRHGHVGARIFALEALVELARILALIAARDLPAERQLARTLADARPGDMVGRTVEAAAARDSRRQHVRQLGRASCRERGGQYVSMSGVGGSVKKNIKTKCRITQSHEK